MWVDAAYQGRCAYWITDILSCAVEVVRTLRRWLRGPADQDLPPLTTGFQELPRRRVAKRTFAWPKLYRRMSKDYQVLPETEEAWVYLAMSCQMTVRLAR